MKFEYNREIISTTYDLKISVADLRDLVNACSYFNKDIAMQEVENVLRCIEHKNRLPEGSLTIE
jgi:hypothetical protein